MIGEIGGQQEVEAARWAAQYMSKPVVAFVAGVSAPRGRRMGHAGAVISGDSDTATAKLDAIEALGHHVVRNPADIGDTVLRAVEGTERDARWARRGSPRPRTGGAGLLPRASGRVMWESPRNETIERPSGDGTWRPSTALSRPEGGTRFAVPEQEGIGPRDRVGPRARRGGGARDSLARVRVHLTSFTPTCGVAGRWSPSTGAASPGRPTSCSTVRPRRSKSSPGGQPGDRRRCLSAPRRARPPSRPQPPTPRARRTTSPLPQACRRSRRSRPTTGSVGSSVVITGTNFGCTNSVMFNTTAATTYVVNSRHQITATVPVGATSGAPRDDTGGGPGGQRDQLHRGRGTHHHVLHADEWYVGTSARSPARTSPV